MPNESLKLSQLMLIMNNSFGGIESEINESQGLLQAMGFQQSPMVMHGIKRSLGNYSCF
jgi:hypothetical protein